MVRLTRAFIVAVSLAAACSASAQSRGSAAPPAREENDFDRNLGHWGLAYFGSRSYDFTTGTQPSQVSVYTAGLRRWISSSGGFGRGWGAEIGLGLVFGNDKLQQVVTGGAVTAASSVFGVGLHGGLPLALAHGRHATIELVPEFNVVFATGTNDLPVKTDLRGLGVDLGARAGVELQLGFIGVPQVSLEGSLGLALHYDYTSVKPSNAPISSHSAWRLGTDAPRGLVAGNLAVLYYF